MASTDAQIVCRITTPSALTTPISKSCSACSPGLCAGIIAESHQPRVEVFAENLGQAPSRGVCHSDKGPFYNVRPLNRLCGPLRALPARCEPEGCLMPRPRL